MKTSLKSLLAAMTIAATLNSCSKSDSDSAPANPGNFIIAATPIASTAVADYLLTTASLDTGTVSTAGNGKEQDGSYRYYVTHRNMFFSMLYGQGNPGAVTTYNIIDGKLNKINNFQTETVQSFAPVNNDILLIKSPRSITDLGATAFWYQVNTDSLKISKKGEINAMTLANNGEIGHFSWIKQVGNKVFAPFFCIIDRSFSTNHPDEAWIAVFSYPEMKLEKVITDNRTSYIGRYFQDGLALVENGDVYAFSPSLANNNGVITTTKPSAVTRIKSGTTEFDNSFFIDFESLTGGLNIMNWYYVGNNNFVTFATTKEEKIKNSTAKTVGILNVANKTYTPVTGLPAKADIASFSTNNYKINGAAYFGVNMTDGVNYVYKVEAGNAKATRGVKVTGGTITAVSHLD